MEMSSHVWSMNTEIQQLCRKGGGSYSRSRTEPESTVSCCCGESKYPAELYKQKNNLPSSRNNPSTSLRGVCEPASRAAAMCTTLGAKFQQCFQKISRTKDLV